MAEVDVLAEQFRHPCSHMHSKQVCLDAPWLTGDDGRHASQPRKVQCTKKLPCMRIMFEEQEEKEEDTEGLCSADGGGKRERGRESTK